MWSDRMQRLYYLDIDSKKSVLVAESPVFEINQYEWSPDSKWITYARPEQDVMTKIYIYSLESSKSIEVTDGWFSSYSPHFSSDGKYLFFISNRNFSPKYSYTEWNHIYNDMAKIYLITLSKETLSPFHPKSDEVNLKKTGEKKDEKKEENGKEEKVTVKVDEDGIKDRIIELPTAPGNYYSIATTGDKVYYLRNSSTEAKRKLVLYDLANIKETELGEVNGYEISADKKKMLISQGSNYAIINLPDQKLDVKENLNLSDLKVNLDKYAEWNQIFNESWRQMRDFFYDPGMHKVDWKKIKENYEPLVKHVNHRADLTYIIGEMIGELNAGHAYVGGGEYPRAERVDLGLLGAKLEKDQSYRLCKNCKSIKGTKLESFSTFPTYRCWC
jgi:tricorn protease